MLSEALSCPSLAKICLTKCDEGGTLQESITQAKVQQIDMVDQHNGSRGCNSRCDAWCSGSRAAIAGPASLLFPSDWRTNGSPGHRRFLTFRFSSGLASIFSLLSFLFQSLDPWMCSSFPCQNSSSGCCSRLCLVLCLSTCFWAGLCLSPCLSSSAALPCLAPGLLPQGLSRFLTCQFGNFYDSFGAFSES